MSIFKSAAAVGLSAFVMGGCGNGDSDRDLRFEAIKIPKGTVDLGESDVIRGGYTSPSRSFLLKNKDVGKLSCGAVISYGDRGINDKKITPAPGDKSQVDCVIKYISNDPEDAENLKKVKVETIK